MAARELWDTKYANTKRGYKAMKGGTAREREEAMRHDVDTQRMSGFEQAVDQQSYDFELPDYWDEGEVLDGKKCGRSASR